MLLSLVRPDRDRRTSDDGFEIGRSRSAARSSSRARWPRSGANGVLYVVSAARSRRGPARRSGRFRARWAVAVRPRTASTSPLEPLWLAVRRSSLPARPLVSWCSSSAGSGDGRPRPASLRRSGHRRLSRPRGVVAGAPAGARLAASAGLVRASFGTPRAWSERGADPRYRPGRGDARTLDVRHLETPQRRIEKLTIIRAVGWSRRRAEPCRRRGDPRVGLDPGSAVPRLVVVGGRDGDDRRVRRRRPDEHRGRSSPPCSCSPG